MNVCYVKKRKNKKSIQRLRKGKMKLLQRESEQQHIHIIIYTTIPLKAM